MNVDYVMVREQLMAILLELDRLNESVAAVYVNQALEVILAKAPL